MRYVAKNPNTASRKVGSVTPTEGREQVEIYSEITGARIGLRYANAAELKAKRK